MSQKLDFYADGGHGWLKVKIAELVELGIADKISNCSYMRNEFAYLEEDGDVSLYCDTKRIIDPMYKLNDHIREHVSDYSTIRRYDPYDFNKYSTTKRLIVRFDTNPIFKKWAIIKILESAKANHEWQSYAKFSYESQKKNFKSWFIHLSLTLERDIKALIQLRIMMFESIQSEMRFSRIEELKAELQTLEAIQN